MVVHVAVLTIGQLAKAAGVTTPTIRYYEEIGLLPKAGRSAAGQRIFAKSELKRLTFIRRCRDFGFSIDQVRVLAGLSIRADHDCTRAKGFSSDADRGPGRWWRPSSGVVALQPSDPRKGHAISLGHGTGRAQVGLQWVRYDQPQSRDDRSSKARQKWQQNLDDCHERPRSGYRALSSVAISVPSASGGPGVVGPLYRHAQLAKLSERRQQLRLPERPLFPRP